MKIHIPFKTTLFCLLLPLLVIGHTITEKPEDTKEKTITKSFNVNSNATLKVVNSYGNLDIVTWDQNKIEFDITIKVSGTNDEKVQERLSDIKVQFSNSSDLVSARTVFGKNNNNSWWGWKSGKKLKIEVHYRIKMPMSNNVDLNNDYGSINLDKLNGHAKLNCDYGQITTKELMGRNNAITFDYSNGCYFEYINSAKINADYSSFTIAKIKSLDLNADYTKSTIEEAQDVSYNCDYGSLKINNINTLEGNGDYLTLRLNNLSKSLTTNASYGSIKIDRITPEADRIDIKSDFVGITIGYDSRFNFTFNLDLEYGSLRGSDRFNFTNKEVDSFEKHYDGYYGDQNSGNLVKINSEYGSITFKETN